MNLICGDLSTNRSCPCYGLTAKQCCEFSKCVSTCMLFQPHINALIGYACLYAPAVLCMSNAHLSICRPPVHNHHVAPATITSWSRGDPASLKLQYQPCQASILLHADKCNAGYHAFELYVKHDLQHTCMLLCRVVVTVLRHYAHNKLVWLCVVTVYDNVCEPLSTLKIASSSE